MFFTGYTRCFIHVSFSHILLCEFYYNDTNLNILEGRVGGSDEQLIPWPMAHMHARY